MSCYDDIHDDIFLLETSKLLFVQFAVFYAQPLFRHFFFWGTPAGLPFFCPFPSTGAPGGWALVTSFRPAEASESLPETVPCPGRALSGLSSSAFSLVMPRLMFALSRSSAARKAA